MVHQKRAETCSLFFQTFEKTVVIRGKFIHLISTNKQLFYVADVSVIPTNLSFHTEHMYEL
jgi:hypothetical protein